ncbi:MAG: hypothetical protein COU63_01620 [Candidatus Pacebacteria bacterium CG10_big_fil_rev_8_21_14_0_10_36_11]|nr:hypothetical protein [Candidatus Pacearchaeota archaeon]OIP73715.1 MAG: hypothetical protein AUK08_04100 [Candidatus Pacebacteria bacterium CG2_30_36_39]PIR64699.1 MAG: hypothetical protein COU63_01620 [Candidatus Pacebacteria bacterium CG10_big_fil_rev_8_21_14_0_10_36_11]PJC43082.1 MAG: hypothetical protein CO040_01005 [Candidatus Pacebacteria bacterium CG_4_9_14_0_2_um_filter_36_8]
MKPKKNSYSQENFMTGFAAGMAAGAIAMYLFGTDEGEKLREDLKDHWRIAAKDLLAEGTIEDAEQDLWGIFKEILDQASEQIEDHEPNLFLADQEKTAAKTNPTKRIRKTKTLFKGV